MKLFYFLLMVSVSFFLNPDSNQKPTIHIIGDSTVKNGQGDGIDGLWGWGDPIKQYFDTSLINVKNHALGGTSSRTYRSFGLWDKVLEQIKPGDYVFMQFGHNDSGNINDNHRARGTIKGIGDETEEIDNILTGKHEIVHSYGWYMSQYIKETREKGGIPVIFSPIPRNDWESGKVPRNDESYGGWSEQVAVKENIQFIDLNELLSTSLEVLGEEKVTGTYFFEWDHTHTTAEGAKLAASLIVEAMKKAKKVDLKPYLLENPQIHFPVKQNIWLIGDSTVANGKPGYIGWGKMLPMYFDSNRVDIINKARGGRSSRSFRYEGLWDEVLREVKAGDYMLIQFGHNDGSPLEGPKFRGSLKGMGEETENITRDDGQIESVHTYGWYMKKYIEEATEKGVKVIILSPIPRNEWSETGKIEQKEDTYITWARAAAKVGQVSYLDLNRAITLEYEVLGEEMVNSFFPNDHTHTNGRGAQLNALILAKEIKSLRSSDLFRFLDYEMFNK